MLFIPFYAIAVIVLIGIYYNYCKHKKDENYDGIVIVDGCNWFHTDDAERLPIVFVDYNMYGKVINKFVYKHKGWYYYGYEHGYASSISKNRLVDNIILYGDTTAKELFKKEIEKRRL